MSKDILHIRCSKWSKTRYSMPYFVCITIIDTIVIDIFTIIFVLNQIKAVLQMGITL